MLLFRFFMMVFISFIIVVVSLRNHTNYPISLMLISITIGIVKKANEKNAFTNTWREIRDICMGYKRFFMVMSGLLMKTYGMHNFFIHIIVFNTLMGMGGALVDICHPTDFQV